MKKKLLAWVLMVLLLLSTCPFAVSASETARVTVQDGTATQGGTVSVYLRADDFVDVSVLDVEVYYDTAAMSVDYVSNSSFLSGASVSTNTAVAGVIKISAMSVNGFSGSGQMMTIRFRVKATCPVGTYPITVAVGDAYDSNLNPATVRGVSGTVTVNAAATQSFSLSSSRSKTTAQKGDTFTVQVRNSGSRPFAGADFRLEYDREQLRLTTLELDSNLRVEGAVYSVNQNNPGYAVISYASTNAVSSYNLFIATFEVIADVTARADIKIIADDVYDNDLVAYAPYTLTTSVQITEKEAPLDYADLMVESDSFILGQTGTASVILQGGAAVAAADFTLHYDPSVFAVSAVTADSAAVAAGAWIVINQNFANGQIKFSYVNEKGSFPGDTELVHITLTAISAPAKHFVLSAAGTGVYNIAYEQTTLDYVSATACIFAPTVTLPTCTEQGYTTYACECGDSYVGDYVPATGHTYDHAYDADCNTCGAVRATEQPIAFGGNSVSEDVSGLAFRFAVTVEGMAMDGSTAIYDSATVGGYKLLAMGAIVTNGVATIDIPAVYLCGLTEEAASFAVRIVNIPANQYDTVLTATSYFVLEMDGVATIIYGEAQTCSYNAALN